ncbi:MAG: reverse gyrase [Thermosphaera sp.]
MTPALNPLYKNSCPICGGDATSRDLEENGRCGKCSSGLNDSLNIFSLSKIMEDEARDFEAFFKTVTRGLTPWGAQKTWVKRILSGENTVLIAPTGMGKTTLLVAYAVFASTRGKRVLYVTPTRALGKQIYLRIVENAGGTRGIVFYDSGLSKKKKAESMELISRGEFKILVITNSFLSRYFELLRRHEYDVVIVDDVDSLLRSEKNILRLLFLLGFTEGVVELAKKRHQLLWKILVNKSLNNEESYSNYIKEYLNLDLQIETAVKRMKRRQLVVASATGRIKGLMGRVLKDLLHVDVSGITIYGRDVSDSYVAERFENIAQELAGVIEKLGPGGIIYTSPRHPFKQMLVKASEDLRKILEGKGFKTAEATPQGVLKLVSKQVDILLGSASYYGSSVRGIDAPQSIRYVVFLGTPVFTVDLESFLSNPNMLARVLIELAEKTGVKAHREKAFSVRRLVYFLSPGETRLLKNVLNGRIPEDAIRGFEKLYNKYIELKAIYAEALEELRRHLDRVGVLEVGSITLLRSQKNYVAIIPDAMTYIQASGRVSRLFNGRMTHGLSVIVEDPSLINLVKGLELKLKMINRDIGFKELSGIDPSREKELIDSTRSGRGEWSIKYRSVLVVVESPTKAKTIARFFGKAVSRRIGDLNIYEIPVKLGDEIVDLNISATRGHLYDLTTDPTVDNYGIIVDAGSITPVYDTIKRCRVCGTQFTHESMCPRCGSLVFSDQRSVVNALRKLANEVDEVLIASDPDIEGEKIAYDVYLAVSPVNKNVWRIELHEITPQEFARALEKKRSIDKNRVLAEIYRRSLDRLVGFSLSQDLWARFGKRHLGAGRVQTPVLGMIIDRYVEYGRSKCRRIELLLDEPLSIKYSTCIDPGSGLAEKAKAADRIILRKEAEEVVEVSPKPPYTTDEFLADAARRGLPVNLAMKIAQDLFEAGLITYHRTDSRYISAAGISIALKYLSSKGLRDLSSPSHWGEPGAHEAIRPVYPFDSDDLMKAFTEGLIPLTIPLTGLHYSVYDMIFKRFITSQMKPFKAVKASFSLWVGDSKLGVFEAYTRIIEDGFNKVAGVRIHESLAGIEEATVGVREFKSSMSSRTPLFSEGDLVTLMKKVGIGRPSTYSKIISSIVRHGYVLKSKKKFKLIPTKTGVEVYKYVSTNYPELTSVELTRRMEEMIDEISAGRLDAAEVILDLMRALSEKKLVKPETISISF